MQGEHKTGITCYGRAAQLVCSTGAAAGGMLLPGVQAITPLQKGWQEKVSRKWGERAQGGGEGCSWFRPWRARKPSQQKVRCSWKPRCTVTLLSVTLVPVLFKPFAVNCVLPVKSGFHLSFLSQFFMQFSS